MNQYLNHSKYQKSWFCLKLISLFWKDSFFTMSLAMPCLQFCTMVIIYCVLFKLLAACCDWQALFKKGLYEIWSCYISKVTLSPPFLQGDQGFNQYQKVEKNTYQRGWEGGSLLNGKNCLFPNSNTDTCSLGTICVQWFNSTHIFVCGLTFCRVVVCNWLLLVIFTLCNFKIPALIIN